MTTATNTPAPTKPQRSGRGWNIIGVAGELLMTLGVVVLLFVAWQLWWTDVLAHRTYDSLRQQLEQEWGIGEAHGQTPKAVKPIPGQAWGLMYVPGLRPAGWEVPIIEGTSLDLLTQGVGHHTSSAMPGELGNVAIAGHRTTYGAPFGDIDTLQPGDQVIIETKNGWYVYELDRSEIIEPWEGWVLDPVPGKPPDTVPTHKLLTIYACHPKFSAAQRFVWFGHQVDSFTKDTATPPAVAAARGGD